MQIRRLCNHCSHRRLEQAFYAVIPIESQGVLAQVALLVQRGEGLLQIPNDILGVLGTDGKTDRGGRDVLLGELLGRELGVRGGSRVHDERLDVGHVGEQREHLQMIDELPSCLLATLNLKGKDRGTATGEVLLIELVIGVLRQARVVHLGDVAVTSQELNDLLGVLDMTVNAQRQSLGALEQDPGVERTDASALVTQQDSADIGCKGGGTGSLGKRDTVVGGVGLSNLGVLSARLPIEVTAVDDHTAQRGAVAADELGCGVDDDIGTMLQRTEQIRGAEGVVDDNRQTVLLGDLG